jgi:predicted ferric reductase
MKKGNVGIIFTFILIFLPVVFWVLRMPLTIRFENFYMTITSIGQILGLLGMAMFIATMILSSRLKFLESYFGGLNKIYFWHHMLGGASFICLLFHPIILVINYLTISLQSAALFFIPINNPAVSFGIFSLLALILMLVFTFFIILPYRTWKITHKFLGAAFFLGILHTFFVSSDVSIYLPLKIYMGIFVFLGLIAYLYRTIFGSVVVKKFKYNVDEVKKLNDKVVEIIMSPIGSKINFKAGQYIFIGFKGEGISTETHPFSISSGIFDEKLKITVKTLGEYTAQLQNLKAGSESITEGPFGVFSYLNTKNKNQVWIAGGVGITPFLSMAKSLTDNEYIIDLYYCVNTKSEIVSLEDLTNISAKNNNFKVIPLCADTDGYINSKVISDHSGNLLEKDFFLCGPPPMMKGARSQLLASGVHNNKIHSEEFSF